MRLRNLATAIAAFGLVATPVLAQSADAFAAREGASVGDAEEMAGGSGVILAVLALAAIVGGVLLATQDDDEPTSP